MYRERKKESERESVRESNLLAQEERAEETNISFSNRTTSVSKRLWSHERRSSATSRQNVTSSAASERQKSRLYLSSEVAF